MLAYVFWHYPDAAADAAPYEARLAAFHRALGAARPSGFAGSAAYRVHGVPWIPRGVGYEDWYEVGDWAALGVLNDAAVSRSMRADHDAVAGLADGGTGAVYRALRAAPRGATEDAVLWLDKPKAVRYPVFLSELEALPAVCALWQRQLTLGPASEFCIAGPDAALDGLRLRDGVAVRRIQRRRLD